METEERRIDRAPTGIEGLDDVLGGGLPINRLYLVQGDPGVGKTTMALQFLLEGLRLGEKVLYISLGETRDEIEAVAASHGWDLAGIELYELSAMEPYLTADADNSVFHPSEVELNETTSRLLELIDRVKPERAAFDSLSEMRLLARDPLRYRRQILALKQFFAGRHCTVLLLDDKTSHETDLQLQSIAHGVILIEQMANSFGGDRRRLRMQKLRGVAFKSGYHDVGMHRGGLTVFPRLVAADHRQSVHEEMISSGILQLDELFGGGIDRGASTLLLGPAGSGKSTIAAQFAVAAAKRGERAMFYSFEESPRTLYKRLSALGMDFKRYVDSGHIVVQHIDPAELTPGEFVHGVRHAIESGEVTMVVIDSLNGYLNAMPEERFLILQLHELLSFLGQCGVSSIIVVAQHGLLVSKTASPIDISYLADTVALFQLYEHRGSLRQAVSIIKRRGGQHDRTIRQLEFGAPDAIQLGAPLDNLRGILSGLPISDLAEGASLA